MRPFFRRPVCLNDVKYKAECAYKWLKTNSFEACRKDFGLHDFAINFLILGFYANLRNSWVFGVKKC